MKDRTSPRNPAVLSESTQRRLGMYAVSATAAAVGILALAQPAEAKIIYTPAHLKIGFGGVTEYKLDLNHDGKYDFRIFTSGSVSSVALVAAAPTSSYLNRLATVRSRNEEFAAALLSGKQVAPWRDFEFKAALVDVTTHNSTSTIIQGPWADVRGRYLGLTFRYKGKTHYGWARLSVTAGPHKEIAAMLTGYAYETVPNKPIITGKTEGSDMATTLPDTGTLGHLALGRK